LLQFLERHEQLSLVTLLTATFPPTLFSYIHPPQLTRTLRASFKASMWFLVVFFVIFIGAFGFKSTPLSSPPHVILQHSPSQASSCGGAQPSVTNRCVSPAFPAPPWPIFPLWVKASRRASG
jgi:hypothetical protein